MATEITMPQLSDTMSEGTIIAWLKSEGDSVSRGEALAEVATDKADLEIEAFDEGTLLKILAPAGEKVQVGSVIAVIGQAGEEVNVSAAPKTPEEKKPELVVESETPSPAAPAAEELAPDRIKVSPLARNLAKQHSVSLDKIAGSGEGGRIVKRDVLAAVEGHQSSPAKQEPRPAPTSSSSPSAPGSKVSDLSRMRQAISARMLESKTTIPHFYMTTKVEVDALVELRKTLKEHPLYEGITFNHLIIKAAALAVKDFPRLNASLKDGQLIQPGAINVGIVTAVDDGLLIPVLKAADELPLSDVVDLSVSLVKRARAGKPKGDDLSGATFSISNVGPFAVEEFSAIISPGQGAILAVSALNDEAVVSDGQIRVAKVIRLTLSADHRIIDGLLSAQFMTKLKELLEKPVLLLA